MAVLKEKHFWESSTLWINVIGIVAIVLEFVIASNIIPDPEIIALLVSILNIANRFRVQKPNDVQKLTL